MSPQAVATLFAIALLGVGYAFALVYLIWALMVLPAIDRVRRRR